MADSTATKMRKSCWTGSTRGIIKSISKLCKVGDFTDGKSTSGYVDFPASSLPADCIVLGWKAVTTAAGAWDDDTTAVLMVGVDGDTDRFSQIENGSVAAAGTIGSVCDATGVYFNEAAATPRVTVTGASDFTAFVTAGTCESTVTIYYIELN